MFAARLTAATARRHGHKLFLEFGKRAIQFIALLERAAVPPVLAFHKGHALAFDGPRENHRRAALGAPGFLERIENRIQIVAVNDEGVPAEGAPAACKLVHVVLPHRRTALAERVDVGDAAQVVETVHGRHIGGFPDRTLSRFAVAHQHVGAIVRLDSACVERRADCGADALTERAGRDVDKRQARRRMALEIRAKGPQLEQIGAVERARFRPRGVEDGRRVPLRHDEAIALGVVRVARIEAHLGKEGRRDEIGRRAATGRMAAAGLGGRSQRIDPQPRRDVLECRNQRGSVKRHYDLVKLQIADCRLQIADVRLEILFQIEPLSECQAEGRGGRSEVPHSRQLTGQHSSRLLAVVVR